MEKTYRIGVLEDDKLYNKLIERTLKNSSDFFLKKRPNCRLEIRCYTSAPVFLSDMQDYDMVVLDYNLTTIDKDLGHNGATVLKQIKKSSPATIVLMISSQDRLNIIADIKKAGAEYYLVKNDLSLRKLERIAKKLIKEACARIG